MNSNEGMNRSRRLSAAMGSTGNSAEKSNQSFILKRGMGGPTTPLFLEFFLGLIPTTHKSSILGGFPPELMILVSGSIP